MRTAFMYLASMWISKTHAIPGIGHDIVLAIPAAILAARSVKKNLKSFEERHVPNHVKTMVAFLALAAAFATLHLKFGWTATYALYAASAWAMTAASWVDLESFLLPDGLVAAAAVLAMAGGACSHGLDWTQTLAGAAAGPAAVWGLTVLYGRLRGREGLGMGDVKLMAAVGAMSGLSGLPWALCCASVATLCAVPAVAWFQKRRGEALPADVLEMATGKDGLVRTAMPFGPFLCLGALASLLWPLS
jgi:prepilin signal peptidase PulO-like enzyme (type II secretory pathway)